LNLVIDASVAAKWFLPDEPFSERALELLLPDLFFSECGNILWKAARRKSLAGEQNSGRDPVDRGTATSDGPGGRTARKYHVDRQEL
jgi:hypothetical protein